MRVYLSPVVARTVSVPLAAGLCGANEYGIDVDLRRYLEGVPAIRGASELRISVMIQS